MLLHWFKNLQLDELRIFIHPTYLELSRSHRGWRNFFAAMHIKTEKVKVEGNDIKALTDTNAFFNPYAAVINTLNTTLSLPEWQNASVSIVLSDHYVRYTFIPAHGLSNSAEQQAFVKHCFHLAFGEQVSGWNVQVSPTGFEKSSLASAIPQDLVSVLVNVLQAQKLRLTGIYPQLMLTTNETMRQLSKLLSKDVPNSFWLALQRDNRLCLALVENGQWLSVSNVIASPDLPSQLEALIGRTSIHHSINNPYPVLVNGLALTSLSSASKVPSLLALPFNIAGLEIINLTEDKASYSPAFQTDQPQTVSMAELEAA